MKIVEKSAPIMLLLAFALAVTALQAQESDYSITLQVDMSPAVGFNPDQDAVYVTGSMFGWAVPGTEQALQTMSRVGSSMIYTKSLQLTPGEHQYKYFLNNGWDGGEWSGDPNRVIQVSENATFDDIWGDFNPACPKPYQLMTANITLDEALLGWTQIGTEATSWDVLYGVHGFDPLTDGTLIPGLSQTEYLLQGLNHSTHYDFYVRAHCGTEVTEWSALQSFWTICTGEEFAFLIPTEGYTIDLGAGNLLDFSYKFTGCADYYVNINLFDESQNQIIWFQQDYVSGSVIITHTLELPMALCSGNYQIGLSYWNNSISMRIEHFGPMFTIINDSDNLQVAQPHEGSFALTDREFEIRWNSSTNDNVSLFYSLDNGLNWNLIAENVSSDCAYREWGFNHYLWTIPSSIDGTYDESLIKVSSFDNPSIFVISKTFIITSIQPLTFIQPAAGEIVPLGSDLDLVFSLTKPSGMGIFIIHGNMGSQYLGYFSASEGENLITYNTAGWPEGLHQYFRIHHHGSNIAFEGPRFAILDGEPGCLPPSNIQVDNIMLASADISWVDYGGSASWDMEWGFGNFEPGEGYLITGIVSNPYTLSGLPQGSWIDFYLQSDCGEGVVSEWAGPFGFQTSCTTIELPYSENFDDFPPYTTPACFSSYGEGGTNVVDHTSFSSPHSLQLSAQPFGTIMLISPKINANLSDVVVRFKALPDHTNLHKTIEVGTVPAQDQGNFTVVSQFELSSLPGQPWQEFAIPFADYAGNDKHIAIRLLNTHDQGHGILIDDLQIKFLPACPEPFNLQANTITLSNATLSWQQLGASTQWDIIYGTYGFNPATEGTLVESLLVAEHEATGLHHSTFYEFYVRGYCDGTASEWSSAGLFRTDCGEASLTFVSPTGSAVFNTNQTTAIPVEIAYVGCNAFFAQVIFVNEFMNHFFIEWISINATGNYIINIQIPNTICSGSYAIGIQYWDNVANETVTHYSGFFDIINEENNLEVRLPWQDQYMLSGRNHQIQWNSSTDEPVNMYYSLDDGLSWHVIMQNVASNCGYFPWGYNQFSWLVPATIQGTYNECRIKVSSLNDPTVFATSERFIITSIQPLTFIQPAIGEIVPLGSDLDLVFSLTEPSDVAIDIIHGNMGSQYLGYFSATEGVNLMTYNTAGWPEGLDQYFRIYHYDSNIEFEGPRFAILDGEPGCLPPGNIQVDNIMLASADISWVDYGGSASWDMEWGFGNFEPGEGYLITGIVSNPYTLSGLPQGSWIDFYLQSACGEGVASEWAGPFGFQTSCTTIELPYSENFDDFPPYTFPACFSSYGEGGTNVVDYTSFSSPHSIQLSAQPFGTIMLISPKINANLSDVVVRFKALPDHTNLHKTIEVGTVPAQDQGNFTVVSQFELSSLPGQPWQEFAIPFEDYAGNDKHIAIRLVNTHEGWQNFYLDNLNIAYLPACPEPHNLQANTITLSNATLSWQQLGASTQWDIIYGTYGFNPATEGTLVESLLVAEHEATGLHHSTFYEFYVRGYCDGTASEWSSAGLFRTDCGEASLTFVSPTGSEVLNTNQTTVIPLEIAYVGCTTMDAQVIFVNEFMNHFFIEWISINATGNYIINIQIPNTICSGSYAIGIQYWDNVANETVAHYSGFFDIINEENNLEVRLPWQDQYMLSGRNHQIHWNSSTDEPVNMYYSLDDGLSWHVIMQNMASNCGYFPWGYNQFSWLVPATIQGTYNECRIKVSSLNDPTVFATSERFIITSIQPLTFIQPAIGEIVPLGSDLDLVFSVTEPSGMDIYITHGNMGSQHLGYFSATEGINLITYNTADWPEGLDQYFEIYHYDRNIGFEGPRFATLDSEPGCLPPGHIYVYNETPTSVDISWINYGGSHSWDMEWGMHFINPGYGTLIKGIAQNHTSITGLTSGIWYTFYLASNCDDDLQSDWVGPFWFYTPSHYTITAFTGDNGNVAPLGAINVLPGADQAFAIEPQPGYEIADVLVDGVSVGAVSVYPFENVTTNHTIAASFSQLSDKLHLAKEEDVTIAGEACFFSPLSIWVAGFGYDFAVQPGGDVTLVAAESIRLLPGTQIASGARLHAHIAIEGVVYCAAPLAPEVADDTQKEAFIVSDDQIAIGISNSSLFKVYPNPTPGRFTLELSNAEENARTVVMIYGLRGELALREELPAGQTHHELSLEGQLPGIYVIRIMTGDWIGVLRLIKF